MSSRARPLRPPSGGTPPPDRLQVGDELIFLAPVAHEAALRHEAAFPDEVARYGPAGRDWCVHDLQYVLSWACLDASDPGVLDRQVAWLARLLAARDYDVRRLARSLELLADALVERHPRANGLARRLRAVAANV